MDYEEPKKAKVITHKLALANELKYDGQELSLTEIIENAYIIEEIARTIQHLEENYKDDDEITMSYFEGMNHFIIEEENQ